MSDTGNLIEKLTSLLPEFDRVFVQPFQTIARKKVTAAQLRVLLTLLSSEPLTMSALARRLDVSRPQLTATVDKLVQIRFIERHYDPCDRRIVSVTLTPDAHAFLRETQEALVSGLAKRFSVLSEQEREQLLQCIHIIKVYMEKVR